MMAALRRLPSQGHIFGFCFCYYFRSVVEIEEKEMFVETK